MRKPYSAITDIFFADQDFLVREPKLCSILITITFFDVVQDHTSYCMSGSSDPPEQIFNIFASENEVYTVF